MISASRTSVLRYVIEGIPAEAVKVISGDGFPAPQRNPDEYAGLLRGVVLNDIPSEIVRSLDRDPTDFNGNLETLNRLWRSALESAQTI